MFIKELASGIFLLTISATVSLIPRVVMADNTPRVGIAGNVGLSGVGADLGLNINEYLGVRGTVDGLTIDRDGKYGTSAKYDAHLKLFQAGALLDVYPFAGIFHLTGGLVDDGNKLTMKGRPTGDTFTFNGNRYPSSDVGSVNGDVDWRKSAPYVGLGWGNLAGSPGFHVTGDLGALLTGKPRAQLVATCSPTGEVNGVCGQLDNDVAAEHDKLERNVHKFDVWPVLRLGFGYAF
jgi:hypothetical protein